MQNGTRRTPQVSVGLPVYNGQRYLAQAVEALLAQTFEDFELIICDNASTDGTEETCRAYARLDSRIRYVRNAVNIGGARNYRLAFELAIAPYFRWATHDDLVAPQLLSRCVEILDRDGAVVLAYPKTRLIDAEGRVISDFEDNLHLDSLRPRDRFISVLERVGMCNAIYGLMRSALLRKTRLMGNFLASDIAFLAELTLYGRFWEISDRLFFRRVHAEAFSSQKSIQRLLGFYNPRHKNHYSARRTRHLWENIRSVIRAPIDTGTEKVPICLYLARVAIWNRREVGAEALMALRQLFS